jgi:hypothetical protein
LPSHVGTVAGTLTVFAGAAALSRLSLCAGPPLAFPPHPFNETSDSVRTSSDRAMNLKRDVFKPDSIFETSRESFINQFAIGNDI